MKKFCFTVILLLTMNAFAQKPVEFVIETSLGDIEGFLYDDTPLHRDNFIKLVHEGWYENSIFHRVIKNFMIQGGHHEDGRVDPGYTLPAEILPNHLHKKGALAAARMGDQINPKRESSGCQFYIVQNPNGTPHLDNQYTVFGEITKGLDVVDAIAAVPANPSNGRPREDVFINTIEITEYR
jgi:cyclophilin family peptidyl-prolyl cis-trans isomerase